MTTPGHPIYLIALAIVLATTTGQRTLDLIGISYVTPGYNPWDGGTVIGAALMPCFAIPLVILLCAIVLRTYPSTPISIFYWREGLSIRRLLWTLFFGALAMGSLLWAVTFAFGITRLVEHGHLEYVADTVFNLVASLGSVYVWLCFRAIACYPRGSQTNIKRSQ